MRWFLLLTTCLCPLLAPAATDGERGRQSTGTIAISLTIAPEVRLSGLRDLRLSASSSLGLEATSPVCVSLRGVSSYQLQASGSAADQQFAMAGGSRAAPYRVYFQTRQARHALAPNVPLTGLLRRAPDGVPCSAQTPDGQLQVEMTSAVRQSLGAGIYAGTLSLTVAPE